MRILIVTQYFWPENFRINDLAVHLSETGHEVFVLTGQPNYPEGKLYPEFKEKPSSFEQMGKVKLIRIPHFLRGTTKASLVLNYFSYFVSASILGAWKLREIEYDVVFVFAVSPITVAVPAILLGKLKRRPILLWVQDLWPETLSAVGVVRSPFLIGLIGKLVSWIYERCDHILIQSNAFASSILKYCAGAKREGKVLYFPNWAEEVFSRNSELTQNAIVRRADMFTILFAGNLGEAQDFPALLDAAEILKTNARIRWVIVGDGRLGEWIRNEVAVRGLTECFLLVGRHPVEMMPAFFSCADSLLVSLKANEIFSKTVPGKVQSYLASGKPIVGMLDGEARAVIEESCGGRTCEAGDSKGLARILQDLAETPPDVLARMGMNGRQFYERNFQRSALFARLEIYLQSVTKGKHLPAYPW